eukprot:1975887-Prymnesium_polylepis.2
MIAGMCAPERIAHVRSSAEWAARTSRSAAALVPAYGRWWRTGIGASSPTPSRRRTVPSSSCPLTTSSDDVYTRRPTPAALHAPMTA